MKTRQILPALWTVTLALGFAPVLLAQDSQEAQTQPSTGVARVGLINGDVSTQRGDSGDWVTTSINAPLVPGDHVATGEGSRTEVQLDFADVLRLDQRSEVKIADLTRSRIQVQLAQGTMDYSVFNNGQADVEIDTPNVAVQPTGQGVYRVFVNGDETQVIVREGTAQISTPQGSTNVKAGDLITIEGTDNPQYQVTSAPRRDEWDEWNRDRDRAIDSAQSYSHTNRYYTGSQDLDRYGHWVHVPDYDYVWQPYAGADWAPYRDGRWVWEPGWGWTWVSYEPWGWAPYHYGRWFYYGDSWCWWPGYVTPVYYPLWAPAYVGFIGFNFGHFGFGFGFGSIGWLPLGPRDYFHPWYGHGGSYTQVNITNVTNITNINNFGGRPGGSNFSGAFTNGHVRGSITTVSSEDFANGRMPRHVGTMSAAQLRQGSVIQGTLPVVPNRQSLSPRSGSPRVPSVAQGNAASRTFFTRNQPPVHPRSFEQNATQIQQMVQQESRPQRGRPTTTAQGGMNTAPGRMESSPGRTAQAGSNNGRFASSGQVSAESAPTARPGWSRFGGRSAPGSNATPRMSGSQGQGGTSPARTVRPQAPTQSAPSESGRTTTASPGWSRFGSSGTHAAAPTSRPSASSPSSPRQSAPRSSPATNEAPRGPARQAPAARNDNPPRAGNWQGFSQQAPSPSRAAPASEPTQSGWNRFSTREPAPRSEQGSARSNSGGPAYRSEPRGESRPPLSIRKPIVQERPQQYYGNYNRGSWGGGSPQGGSYSAPNRNSGSWGGGNRGGGGYSSPAPRSMGNYGGGSPSRSSGSWGGGGGGRSAPARSSNSGGHSGGGNRRH